MIMIHETVGYPHVVHACIQSCSLYSPLLTTELFDWVCQYMCDGRRHRRSDCAHEYWWN